MIRAHLLAIRAAGEALAAQGKALVAEVDTLLEVLPEERHAPAPIPGGGHPDPEVCPHPQDHRLPAGVMGYPSAWVCAACDYEGGRGPDTDGGAT